MKKNILSMTESSLRDEMLLIGEKPYRGSQIYKWVNKGYHFSEMNNIPSDLIEKMSDDYTDGLLELTALKRSDDGTKKFLFRLEDGAFVEAVLMNYSFGSSVCISTQTVIANAIRHALYPGNFRILIATINQMMGSNTRMNLINI